ncbi:protein of unknown function [Cyclobacterium lianum]|uniref:3-keto-alpha-glucoside-1,2-lyase/3-keto-2-hydroxy-glucal hydratase domain-containing protein n=1 Tax=Cyclobacterium lianum TaxID=388280 RepID=A0A1M7ID91_9BACT|nr:DUF1080 domain-containing protein [Cyclobacterium lianum]SHM38417.1 protein of unknown function [Cyclobacterium lianum]
MKKFSRMTLMAVFSTLAFACGSGQQNDSETESVAEAVQVQDDNDGFKQIFDGSTLNGWDGDPTYWRVEDGALIGEITEETTLERNHFIIWQGGQPADFEFKAEFKITEAGNSGVNYRSEPVEGLDHALKGYQADIDGRNNYTGQNYEERKRTTLAYIGQKTKINPQEKEGDLRANVERNAWLGLEVVEELGDREEMKKNVKSNDWNEIHIIAKGNRLQHYINGTLMSDVTDEDPANRTMKGYLGMQVHVGPPMQVAYKNIYIKEL